ncbi:hypothetical protein MTR67_039966 [Solanum verrucosum]|uniref:Uncharacterized protein n=1 Tax=Solanum verrucosum TaxID=315347 RepID=A0AAF0UJ92_SOLVR|nr:hypothetical protein MTR67_039966 [Solanum verrucosum]
MCFSLLRSRREKGYWELCPGAFLRRAEVTSLKEKNNFNDYVAKLRNCSKQGLDNIMGLGIGSTTEDEGTIQGGIVLRIVEAVHEYEKLEQRMPRRVDEMLACWNGTGARPTSHLTCLPAAEVDLQHSAIWIASVYLMLLMHFLENKVAVDLTRSEFVEAQEVNNLVSLLKRLTSKIMGFYGWRGVALSRMSRV